VFQAAWEEFQAQMAAKYDGNPHLKYVVIAGPGKASESFLVKTTTDEATANSLAVAAGYPDLTTAWQAGTDWLINMYRRHWVRTPVIIVTGTPFPDGGIDALQAVYNYIGTLTGMGGARCDGLTAVYPPFGTPSSAPCGYWIQQLSPISSAVGYQSHNAQNLTDPAAPTKLNSHLQLALHLIPHFI